MPCRHCGEGRKSECNLCYRIKNGMPSKKYYAICARIFSVYPVRRKRNNFRYPRVVGHPLCKNKKCIAQNPDYSDLGLKNRKNIINENEFYKLIQKPCIFCGISPCNGVDRCDSRFTYYTDNVQPCCFQCNIMKKNIDTDIFINKIYNVYTTNKI